MNQWLGFYKTGIQQAREALEIYEQIGDTANQAHSLNTLASVLCYNNQLDAAEIAAFRTINLAPGEDHGLVVCKSHRLLGDIYQYKGRKEKAIHHYDTTISIVL